MIQRLALTPAVVVVWLFVAPTVLAAGLPALASATPKQAAAAPATSFTNYRYAGNEANNAANEGVYGDIRAESESYGGSSSNHMAAWLGSNTGKTADSGNMDWIQAGYIIGSADGLTETSQVMYEETNDYTVGWHAVMNPYPQFGLGNQFFESIMTSQTSGSRGLYYMFVGTTLIGQSWLIYPTDTYQEALVEGYDNGSSSPSISDGLFGTTGSNNSYTSSTQLGIISHAGNELWGTEISTSTVSEAPYTGHWWVDFSAFQGYG